MNDDELRALIRAAIQKHMGSGDAPGTVAPGASGFSRIVPESLVPVSISFGQYRLERAAGDTSCLIEPAVQCNHCGFCKCHGH
jgi:hypothetical protein